MESVSSTPVPAIAATPPPHSAAPSPSSLPNYQLPPELGQVIAWQNEQLMKLQEQVSALIAASPPACPHTPPACGPGGPSCDTASPHLRKNVVCAATNTNATSNNYSNTNNVATNTSTLWPQLGQCLERLRQDSLERDTVNRDMERDTEAGNREILPWSQAQAQARVSREENNVSVEPNRNIEKSSSYQNTPGEM